MSAFQETTSAHEVENCLQIVISCRAGLQAYTGGDGNLGGGSLPAGELSVMEIVVHAEDLQFAGSHPFLDEVEGKQVLQGVVHGFLKCDGARHYLHKSPYQK